VTIQETVQQALQHHQAGRREQAKPLYRQALAIDPNNHAVMFMLAALLMETGEMPEAEQLLSKATELAPTVPEYQNAFGIALSGSQQFAEAAAAFRRALQLRPNYPDAHCGLGRALHRLGDAAAAAAVLTKAVEAWPNFAPAHAELANALRACGELDRALAAGERAVRVDPNYAWGHNILGMIQHDRKDYEAAFASFRRAIALNPQMAEAYLNVAQVRQSCGQLTQAIEALKKAAQLAPRDPRPMHNLGVVMSDIGLAEDAVGAFSSALALNPLFNEAHSALLMTLNYHPGYTPRQRFDAHRQWGSRHGGAPRMFDNDRTSGRRLRVGYVSPDFCRHPVSWFIEPILKSHDRAKFEVYCYADVSQADDVTARLRGLPVVWREITALGHDAAAQMIRGDKIDILVDLAGHTRRGRLLMFARRPAPVQVTYLGYPNTTGLTAMDYRLTDAYADPPGESDQLHTEKLIRLAGGFLCYCPPADSPPVGTRQAGTITFGSFNNMAKLTSEAIALWSKILAAVPGSRLLLKNQSLGDPQVAQRLAEAFAREGVEKSRLELRPPAAQTADHLRVYGEVDIALDTFPYNGTTTTCEALWMGVPVITLAGDTHAGRVGASLLHQVGLAELIGKSAEEYAALAVGLAGDAGRLESLRAGMRDRLRQSPLLDARRITAEIESAYQSMWQTWCGGTQGVRR
jgi:protein O-GlcNAc transferase